MKSHPEQQSISISAVERETGLSKDTLRIWERRYGFQQPIRDAGGDRPYPYTQVDRLRIIKRLVDAGLRPGKLVPCPDKRLLELAQACGQPAPPPGNAHELDRFIALIKKHHGDELAKLLQQQLVVVGLRQFVIETVAQLNVMVGEVVSLGTLAPISNIATAAVAHQVDIVGLSFSGAYPVNLVGRGLRELHNLLPDNIAIWAGGVGTTQVRRAPEKVTVLRSLPAVAQAISAWRSQHGAAAALAT